MSQEIEIIPEVAQPSVPWTILDVVLFLVLWFVAQIAVGLVVGIVIVVTHSPGDRVLVKVAPDGRTEFTTDETGYQHPATQLIQKGKQIPIVLFVAFVSMVVAAPLIEEFLFRMILQGWLETKLLQFRVPCAGGIAITVTSCGFALIHLGDSGHFGLWPLFVMFVAFSIVNLLLFVFGIVYLILLRKAKMTDYFFGTERFFRPGFFRIAGYCLLVVLFCQGLGIVLGYMYESTNVSLIPIFFFSLALGALYSKTKNLSYCILLHACMNAVALALVLLTV